MWYTNEMICSLEYSRHCCLSNQKCKGWYCSIQTITFPELLKMIMITQKWQLKEIYCSLWADPVCVICSLFADAIRRDGDKNALFVAEFPPCQLSPTKNAKKNNPYPYQLYFLHSMLKSAPFLHTNYLNIIAFQAYTTSNLLKIVCKDE